MKANLDHLKELNMLNRRTTLEDLEKAAIITLRVLRENRGTLNLSEEDVILGDSFILSLFYNQLFFGLIKPEVVERINKELLEGDIEYIEEEMALLYMGVNRN